MLKHLGHSMATQNDNLTPPLQRLSTGEVDLDSVPDVIEWFLNYDQRVAVIRHSSVEEVFQFNRAEDRLAIGIIQALADNPGERELHSWISQLLNALETASKATERVADSYQLDLKSGDSIVEQANKIPYQRGR